MDTNISNILNSYQQNEYQRRTALATLMDFTRQHGENADLADMNLMDALRVKRYLLNESVQQMAPFLDNYYNKALGGKISPSKDDLGDIIITIDGEEKVVELKTSFTNKRETMNLRQVRLDQHVDYYLLTYVDIETNTARGWLVDKESMASIVAKHGSYSHRTRDSNEGNEKSEYSVTFTINKKKAAESSVSAKFVPFEVPDSMMRRIFDGADGNIAKELFTMTTEHVMAA